MKISGDIGLWISVFFTIGVYSVLYKENVVSRFIENLTVGLGAGYMLCMGAENIKSKVFAPISAGKSYEMLIPLVLGLMLFARFFPQYKYATRLPIAIMTATGTALTLRGSIQADLIGQVRAAMTPFSNLDGAVMFFGAIGTLMYFLFTVKKNPVIGAGAEVGKWVMMASFGAGFGNTVAGRISMVIARIDVVLRWLGLGVK